MVIVVMVSSDGIILRRVHMDYAKWIECAFNPVIQR